MIILYVWTGYDDMKIIAINNNMLAIYNFIFENCLSEIITRLNIIYEAYIDYFIFYVNPLYFISGVVTPAFFLRVKFTN